MLRVEDLQEREFEEFDAPEKPGSEWKKRLPIFEFPIGYAYAALVIISEIIAPDGIDPLQSQISSSERLGEVQRQNWDRLSLVNATDAIRFWVHSRINADPQESSWTETTAKFMRKISDRSKHCIETLLRGPTSAWRECWQVPEDCDPSLFIPYVFAKTKNPQAEQWFIFPSKQIRQTSLVAAFALYSIKLPNEEESDRDSELSCHIRKLLLQYDGMPAMALFGWGSVVIIGDSFTMRIQLESASKSGVSLSQAMEDILEKSFVLAAEYSLNIEPMDFALVKPQAGSPYHSKWIKGDIMFIQMMRQMMGAPIDGLAVGKILKRYLKYPAVFIRECGFSENVAVCVSQLIETRMAKMEERVKATGFSNCGFSDVISAYQQYKRLTKWISGYVLSLDDPSDAVKLSSTISAVPWMCELCVAMSAELGTWALRKDASEVLMDVLAVSFDGMVKTKASCTSPELVMSSSPVDTMPVSLFLKENEDMFRRISATSRVVYGRPPMYKLAPGLLEWLERFEFESAF